VLELLAGHPLALTWAGNLLARDDEDPARLANDWAAEQLPSLSDPSQAEHTLKWIFARSVRGLDGDATLALEAAGLLAHAPFPFAAIVAASAQAEGQAAGEAPARAALKVLVQHGLLRRSATEADCWLFSHVLAYRFARKETGSDPLLRERLGRWLDRHLAEALAANPGGEAVVSLARPLQHAAALLRADEDQRLWQPLAEDVLYDAYDRLEALGRLDLFGPFEAGAGCHCRVVGVFPARQGGLARMAARALRTARSPRQRFA
jgi:hypothetical protein